MTRYSAGGSNIRLNSDKMLSDDGDSIHKIAEDRDVGAFRALFQAFAPKVRTMLLRRGVDSETADEIVQDTMLTVWCKSHLFAANKGSVSAWIYTIARNLRIDRIRKQNLLQQLCADLEVLQTAAQWNGEPYSRPQERSGVEQALAALPAEQLQIVELSFIEGLSQNEIAKRLNLPLGTVKSRMRLAFGKMRNSAESAL
jgi:RNA polymerase sigma-70 factor (ECF subfamily)